MNLATIFEKTINSEGGWKTADHDIQHKTLEIDEDHRMLALQGSWSYVDLGHVMQCFPGKTGLPKGLESVADTLRDILCDDDFPISPRKKLIISGWSWGGMMAVSYSQLGLITSADIEIIAFGAPKVFPARSNYTPAWWGSPEYPILNVVHRRDLLAKAYPFFYKRPGWRLDIGEKGIPRPKYHSQAVYLDELKKGVFK
jgi:hypothetical protein